MSINKQIDTAIVTLLNKEVNDIYNIFNIKLDNLASTNNDKAMSQRNYDKYNRQLKSTMLSNNLDKISNSLSKRFGITIKVEYLKSGLTSVCSLMMPPVNYKMMNMALTGLDDLFPKKKFNETLWAATAGDKETRVYNILNDLKNGLSNGSVEIDLDNANIKGLDNSKFVINVDFFAAKMLGLTTEEVTAMIIQKVGNIFSYIEYMTSTTNSTKVLADTFLKERFGKSKDPIDSLKFAIDKTDTDVSLDTSSPIKIMETLDLFILKTYRLDSSNGSVKIDFTRLADQFATKFGIGGDVASYVLKLSTADVKVGRNGERYLSDGTNGYILTFLAIVAATIATLLFSIVGLFVVVLYVTVKLIGYMMALVTRFIVKIFSLILTSGTDMNYEMEDVGKRLKKIQLEIIRELRTTKATDNGKELLIDQADVIKGYIKQLEGKFTLLSDVSSSSTSLKYSKMEDINFMSEQLQENELHLLKEKFNLKG